GLEIGSAPSRKAGVFSAASNVRWIRMTNAPHIPVAESLERIQCQWCQSLNEKAALACRSCGAPLDVRNLVSESGWREAPRIRDMTEIHFSNSTCQVEGEIVPVAEISLTPGDAIFFEHHVMLW